MVLQSEHAACAVCPKHNSCMAKHCPKHHRLTCQYITTRGQCASACSIWSLAVISLLTSGQSLRRGQPCQGLGQGLCALLSLRGTVMRRAQGGLRQQRRRLAAALLRREAACMRAATRVTQRGSVTHVPAHAATAKSLRLVMLMLMVAMYRCSKHLAAACAAGGVRSAAAVSVLLARRAQPPQQLPRGCRLRLYRHPQILLVSMRKGPGLSGTASHGG